MANQLKGKKSKNQHLIGACALLLNLKEEVLLGRRKNSYKAGMLELPGGHIETNEPIIVAIRREVEEETSLKPDNLEYLGVVRENQGSHDFIHFVFVAKNITQPPQLCEPEKCEGWEWINLEKIKAMKDLLVQVNDELSDITDMIGRKVCEGEQLYEKK